MNNSALRVHDILHDRILISRESARLLEGPLRAMVSAMEPAEVLPHAPTVIDFTGVEGIAPSFVTELLSVLEAVVAAHPESGHRQLVIANPPTRLSSKFEAVARGHRLSARECPEGTWSLESGSNSAA